MMKNTTYIRFSFQIKNRSILNFSRKFPRSLVESRITRKSMVSEKIGSPMWEFQESTRTKRKIFSKNGEIFQFYHIKYHSDQINEIFKKRTNSFWIFKIFLKKNSQRIFFFFNFHIFLLIEKYNFVKETFTKPLNDF